MIRRLHWEKRGPVYSPTGTRWWARSHAFLPTPIVLDAETIRVYYSSLDEHLIGRVGYVDLDAADPSKVLYESLDPVLDIGRLGAFDDSGVTPSCVVASSDQLHLYYIGWQRAERVPYLLFSGVAASTDGGVTFERLFETPVLDRTNSEPFSRAAPFVLREASGFRMWYWSCRKWTREGDWIHYNNEIRCAKSSDGMAWNSCPSPCIEPSGDEYSVGRPWVVRDEHGYQMWFSIRSRVVPYHLGYAESSDGVHWERHHGVTSLERSESGWDSEMVAFASVIEVGGRLYLFYNGNGNGRTGFGYAIAEAR
jgi:hypothetical protein